MLIVAYENYTSQYSADEIPKQVALIRVKIRLNCRELDMQAFSDWAKGITCHVVTIIGFGSAFTNAITNKFL